MKAIDTSKMDKSALSVASTFEKSDDKEYWQSKTPQERLQAVELRNYKLPVLVTFRF